MNFPIGQSGEASRWRVGIPRALKLFNSPGYAGMVEYKKVNLFIELHIYLSSFSHCSFSSVRMPPLPLSQIPEKHKGSDR